MTEKSAVGVVVPRPNSPLSCIARSVVEAALAMLKSKPEPVPSPQILKWPLPVVVPTETDVEPIVFAADTVPPIVNSGLPFKLAVYICKVPRPAVPPVNGKSTQLTEPAL